MGNKKNRSKSELNDKANRKTNFGAKDKINSKTKSNDQIAKDDISNSPVFKWQYLVVYLLIASLLSFGLIEFKIKKDAPTSTAEQTVKVSVTSDDGSFDVDKQTGEKVEQIEEPGTIGEKHYGTTVPSETDTSSSSLNSSTTTTKKTTSSSTAHSSTSETSKKTDSSETTNKDETSTKQTTSAAGSTSSTENPTNTNPITVE